jgi:hypothetical protein
VTPEAKLMQIALSERIASREYQENLFRNKIEGELYADVVCLYYSIVS